MTPPGYGWWEWQFISNGYWWRAWLRFGWVAAFIPLGIAALIMWIWG